jgi:hypothetical protein
MIHDAILRRLLAVASLVTLSCGAGNGGLNHTSVTCSQGRTLLDGVCVSEQIADYVSCVRAQGAQLGAEKGQKLSAEVGYGGVRAGGAAELNEALQKKYSGSDETMLAIVQARQRANSHPLANGHPAASPLGGLSTKPAARAPPTRPDTGTRVPFRERRPGWQGGSAAR